MKRGAKDMLSALRQMNVTDINANVEDLSGGQRQAVAIARGVRLGSRVLILDEPTAALGVRESRGVLELLQSLRSEHRTVLIVSHNLAHVFEVCDRITVLRGGRAVGTVARSASDPDAVVKMITGSS
jgi:ABC-type sugar transport system ATPase subunit